MKVLLDENMPKKLKYRFNDNFEVITVPELGWTGIKNGDLLRKMQTNKLSVLISIDKNMSYQQNLDKFGVSLIVIDVDDGLYKTLVRYIDKIEVCLLDTLEPGLILIN